MAEPEKIDKDKIAFHIIEIDDSTPRERDSLLYTFLLTAYPTEDAQNA